MIEALANDYSDHINISFPVFPSSKVSDVAGAELFTTSTVSTDVESTR